MKMLQVEDETHKQIKMQAVAKGMTIKEYIQHLADIEEQRKDEILDSKFERF